MWSAMRDKSDGMKRRGLRGYVLMGCAVFALGYAPAHATDNAPVPAGPGGGVTVEEMLAGRGAAPPVMQAMPAQTGEAGQAAQNNQNTLSSMDAMARDFQLRTALRSDLVPPDALKTLFFTAWQHALLQEAREQFRTRPPTEAELQSSLSDSGVARAASGPRELSLGGIAYRSVKDWTIWLNGQRITPAAIPSEVMDIKVGSQQIEMKWFDRSTNLIYPVRLRPHQRFNLDSRLFLPGTGTEQTY